MRILTLNLLAAALLLFGAASASAFAVSMVARGATTGLQVSDTVTVDVFLDATGGITIFSVAVLVSDPAVLSYDGPASAALPPSGVGTSGAQQSYVLYGGMGKSATYLVPAVTPYFLTFPGSSPTGGPQINVFYTESSLGTTTATGVGIYVATLVFHVVQDFAIDSETLQLAFLTGNVIQDGTRVVDPSDIGLSGPITLRGTIPEPTTAMLIGLGIIGLGLAGRRRA